MRRIFFFLNDSIYGTQNVYVGPKNPCMGLCVCLDERARCMGRHVHFRTVHVGLVEERVTHQDLVTGREASVMVVWAYMFIQPTFGSFVSGGGESGWFACQASERTPTFLCNKRCTVSTTYID